MNDFPTRIHHCTSHKTNKRSYLIIYANLINYKKKIPY
ncbi:hypothetical protein NT04LM_2923, partial [Listeria monocytogenes FSL F2-208]